jgi:hypothetical protein
MNAPPPAPQHTWPARLVQLATVAVVAAIAAATFVLSYSGVHAIALQSGVPVELARFYPAVFDAVLVVACAAVPLRTRWLTRGYTWLVIIVVVGLVGAMDVVHAMNVTFPRRQAAGVAAVLPWVLLLLAFSLWLAILRHFRALTAGSTGAQEAAGAEGAGPRLEEPGTGDVAAGPEGLADELLGADPDDSDGVDAVDVGPGDPASVPDEEAAESPTPEIPGIPYATGPRLHRVRSLPAPPVDDGDEG